VIHHSLSKFCLHFLLTLDLSFLRLVQEYLHIILLYIHLISLSPLPQLSPAISASLSLHLPHTVKKRNIFILCKEIQKGSVAKSYMTKYLRISSYMTLHLIPSEFPDICGKFSFLFNSAPSLSHSLSQQRKNICINREVHLTPSLQTLYFKRNRLLILQYCAETELLF